MHGIYFIVKQCLHSGFLFMPRAQSAAVFAILMRIMIANAPLNFVITHANSAREVA